MWNKAWPGWRQRVRSYSWWTGKGSVKDTINTKIFLNNIAITSDGEILLTNFYGCCINSVSKEKKISILFKTGKKPTGLCCLHNGDIVVTFSDDSEVIVYSRSGQIKQALDHIKFRYPRKVAENKVNQDLYICDHEVHNCYSLGKVIAVKADGQQSYEYTGKGETVILHLFANKSSECVNKVNSQFHIYGG